MTASAASATLCTFSFVDAPSQTMSTAAELDAYRNTCSSTSTIPNAWVSGIIPLDAPQQISQKAPQPQISPKKTKLQMSCKSAQLNKGKGDGGQSEYCTGRSISKCNGERQNESTISLSAKSTISSLDLFGEDDETGNNSTSAMLGGSSDDSKSNNLNEDEESKGVIMIRQNC